MTGSNCRYKEFRELYEKLKKAFPKEDFKFPSKRFMGNFDPEFIKVGGGTWWAQLQLCHGQSLCRLGSKGYTSLSSALSATLGCDGIPPFESLLHESCVMCVAGWWIVWCWVEDLVVLL